MELSKEFVTEHKLSDEQVKAVTEYGKTVLSTEKTKIEDEWKDKAHKDAQGILSGAAESVEKLTGIKRKDSEKIADYFGRSGSEFVSTSVSTKQAELDKLKVDYEEKIKGVDGNKLKEEYDKMKAERADIIAKFADYDTVKEKASKADELGVELSGLKLEVAYSKVKPSFPDTVNAFEAAAKWDIFKKAVEAEYTIELLNGEAIAVSKKNSLDTKKLADLVAKDETLQALTKGRQQNGSGSKQAEKRTVDGLPFEVPVNAETKDYAQLIRDQLAKENIKTADTNYPAQFKKYMDLIKQQKDA